MDVYFFNEYQGFKHEHITSNKIIKFGTLMRVIVESVDEAFGSFYDSGEAGNQFQINIKHITNCPDECKEIYNVWVEDNLKLV